MTAIGRFRDEMPGGQLYRRGTPEERRAAARMVVILARRDSADNWREKARHIIDMLDLGDVK